MTSQMADRTVFVGVLQAAKDYVGPEDCILCIPGQADIPLRSRERPLRDQGPERCGAGTCSGPDGLPSATPEGHS